jgi:uncharacterized membrane protein YhaH (DUF805 family)
MVEGALTYEERMRALQKPTAVAEMAARAPAPAVVLAPPVSALAYEGSDSVSAVRRIRVFDVLWGVEGRISRSEFWLKGLLPLMPAAMAGNALAFLPDSDAVAWVVLILVNLVLLFPFVSVYGKRLHDRGRSAKWLFATAIPMFGQFVALWIMLETWLRRGEPGSNSYGEDPLDPPA